jgi:hypothetical protein
MANLQARGGSVRVRVGGNTQDYATMFDSLPNGKMMEKEGQDTANPVRFPVLTLAMLTPLVDENSGIVVHSRCSAHDG